MEPGCEGGQLLSGVSEDELERAFGRALAPPPELTADDLIEITQPEQPPGLPPPSLASVLAEIPDLPPPVESPPAIAPVVAWGQFLPKPAEPPRRRSPFGVAAIMAGAAAAGLAIGVFTTTALVQRANAPRRSAAPPRALIAGRAAPPAPEVRPAQGLQETQPVPLVPLVAAPETEQLPGRPVTQVMPVPSGPIAAQNLPAPAPALPVQPPKRAARAVPAQLTPAAVMQVVVAHKADVVACLDAARAEDPELTGTLEMRWTVAPGGEVEDVQVVTPEHQGSELGACVAGAISGWQFPRHTDLQPPITFPFRF